MPNREDIVLFAAYNTAMNTNVYAAAATLSTNALNADRGAFFGSILGTLNHLVAGDTIWLQRYQGHPTHFRALEPMKEIAAPTGLTHRYSDDLGQLRAHRMRLDAIIEALAAELSDADLAQPVSYRNSRGENRKQFGSLLLHFFNHQTHHRGQASTLLSQSNVDIGVTDLVAWIPDLD